MSRSKQDETNKTSFTIFGSIFIFYDFCKLKHTQVQQGLLLASTTAHLLHVPEQTHDVRDAADGCAAKQGRRGAGDARKACSRRWQRRRGATTGRRDDERRRRVEGCANDPAGRGRRPGEEVNRAREGRKCSPRKESRSSSPKTTNRRRG
jgi:hypothetical protein